MIEHPPPYFKFSPQKWMKGEIFTCSWQAQGVFANLCGWYWMRKGQMTYKQALKRYPDDLLEELIEDGILKAKGGVIRIEFLDEQLEIDSPPPKKRMVRTKPQKSFVDGGYNPPDVSIGGKEGKGKEKEKEKEKLNKKEKFERTKNTFISQVNKAGADKYSESMIQDFIDYWTETKPNGFIQRWEMQPTFDYGRRLGKWKSNETKFNPGKKAMGSRSGKYGGYNYRKPKG